MSSWRHFRLGAAQLPAPKTVKRPSPAGTLLPGSGAGWDAECEQGRVIAGPVAGVKSQDLAEAADGGGGVQAVRAGQGLGQGVLAEQRRAASRELTCWRASVAPSV